MFPHAPSHPSGQPPLSAAVTPAHRRLLLRSVLPSPLHGSFRSSTCRRHACSLGEQGSPPSGSPWSQLRCPDLCYRPVSPRLPSRPPQPTPYDPPWSLQAKTRKPSALSRHPHPGTAAVTSLRAQQCTKIPVSSERPRWQELGICHLSFRPRLLTLSHHVSAVSPPLSLKGAPTLQGSPRHTRRPPAGQDWGPATPRWEWITLSRAARPWTSLKLSEPPQPLSERRQAPLQPPRGPSNTTNPRPSDRMGKLPGRTGRAGPGTPLHLRGGREREGEEARRWQLWEDYKSRCALRSQSDACPEGQEALGPAPEDKAARRRSGSSFGRARQQVG